MERKQTCYSTDSRCRGHLPHTGEKRSDYQEPTFQSSEVTSLLLGTSCPPSRIQWRSTSWVELELLFSFRFQIRAVESPELNRISMNPDEGGVNRLSQYQHVIFRSNKVVYLQKKEPKRCCDDVWLIWHEWRSVSAHAGTHPEASRSLTGFQAHMKTSDSWPRSTVALLAGISTSTSISMGSLWLSEQRGGRRTCVFTYSISAPTAQQTKIPVHILIHFECLLHNCALCRKEKHSNSFVMECPINVHLQQHVKPSACPQTVKSHATLLLPSTLWNYRSGCADTNLSALSTLPLTCLSHRWSSAAANDVECCETMWRLFIRKTRRSLWQECSRYN